MAGETTDVDQPPTTATTTTSGPRHHHRRARTSSRALRELRRQRSQLGGDADGYRAGLLGSDRRVVHGVGDRPAGLKEPAR